MDDEFASADDIQRWRDEELDERKKRRKEQIDAGAAALGRKRRNLEILRSFIATARRLSLEPDEVEVVEPRRFLPDRRVRRTGWSPSLQLLDLSGEEADWLIADAEAPGWWKIVRTTQRKQRVKRAAFVTLEDAPFLTAALPERLEEDIRIYVEERVKSSV